MKKTIFETVEQLNGLTPTDIFEVVDLTTLTESQISERFGTPCFVRSSSSLNESTLPDKAEQSLKNNAVDGSDGFLVPEKDKNGKTRFKLGNDKVKAVVFSMSPAYECSSDRLGMCMSSEACYAKRDENQYPGVGPARMKQKVYWENVTAEQFVEDFKNAVMPNYRKIYGKSIEKADNLADIIGKEDPRDVERMNPKQYEKMKQREELMNKGKFKAPKPSADDDDPTYDPSNKKNALYTPGKVSAIDRANWLRSMVTPIKFFRFNESGDFGSQEDVQKMSEIAGMLKQQLGVVTYSYTARNDLNFSGVKFIIKGSGYPNLTSNGHTIVFPEHDEVPKGYIGCHAIEKGVSCLLGCRACLTNRNVAFRQHSGQGAMVDKVVCDRYKKVYAPDSEPEGDYIILKDSEDANGKVTYLFTSLPNKKGSNVNRWVKAQQFSKGATKPTTKHMVIIDKSINTRFKTEDDALAYVKEFLPSVDGVYVKSIADWVRSDDESKRAGVVPTKIDPYRKLNPRDVGVRESVLDSIGNYIK